MEKRESEKKLLDLESSCRGDLRSLAGHGEGQHAVVIGRAYRIGVDTADVEASAV